MAAVAGFVIGDWSIDRDVTPTLISYIGDDHGGASPSYATVLEFHRGISNFADDATSVGDDEHDITDPDATDRSTDNIITLLAGYQLNAAAIEHLYDGSIIFNEDGKIWDGIVNFGNAVTIQIAQDGAILSDDWWNNDPFGEGFGLNGDAAAGISHRFLVEVRDTNGVDIDQRRLLGLTRQFGNTYAEFGITQTARGNNVLALSESNDIFNNNSVGNVGAWTGISNTEGFQELNIDGTGASGQAFYSEWENIGAAGTGLAGNVNDIYEYTKYLTRDGESSTLYGIPGELFRGVTQSFAYDGLTGAAPTTGDQWSWGTELQYDNEGGSGPFVVGDVIEESGASNWFATVLAVDDNGTTGTLIVRVESGTITNNENFTTNRGAGEATAQVNGTPTAVSGGGTVAFLAVDTSGTNAYIQVLKGGAPVDNTRIYDDADAGQYLDVNGTVTSRPIAPSFLGASTGSNIIGGYGIGFQVTPTAVLGSSDQAFDLTNTQRVPPNNVTFTLSGLDFTTSNEDRILVGPEDGAGGLDEDQLSLNGTLSTDNITSVVVSTSIPLDTPATGTIRVRDDNGRFRRLSYSSYTGSTFTINSTDGEEDFNTVNATTGNDVFISYIDRIASAAEETFSGVNLNRTVFIRVRNAGNTPIKPFTSTSNIAGANTSASVSRISDA